ncbi:MAG: hypothetical protein K2Q22_14120, partial [Cytophagales bacterium]|nr:hypothetical protein [Cytophagales bacterium]
SNPATTLVSDSYTNLFPVVGNCIQAPNIVISSICSGTPLAINVPVNVVTSFNPGNQFTLELSSSSGNFAASTILGSILATGNTTISGIVPANLPTGSNYQIRVKASNWSSTSNPSNGFTINQLCLTPAFITGPFCNQQPTNLSFNVSGVTNSSTVYSVELFEYYWNFNAYVNGSRGIIGTITTSSLGNISVPVRFPSVGYVGSQFRVVIRSSNPLSNSDYSNFFTINGNCIDSPVVSGVNNGCSATQLPVNISFTSPATFDNGNIFIAELSNASGVFNSPMFIGSVAGLVSASLTGILPANLPSGNYSIRVRSTSWSSTSPGSSFFSTNALCMTNTVSGIYCKGQPMTVNFTVNGAVGGGNTYTVQLSDRFGNFGSPTTLGTYNTSVGGDLNLTATVPSTLVAGSGYRVRVVASNPASVGYDNGQNIVINDYCISAPTVASYYCVGTPVNLTLPVVATSVFSPGNLFVAELSDASGNFANSSIIGFVSASTSTSLAATIPANLPSGTQYQIRIRSNAFPIIGQATSGITIDQICINTNSISGTFCNNNNDQIQLGFDVVGQTNSSTTYNAQLIRNGFGTVYALGSLTSGATSGLFITSTITNALPAGSYTARVVSSTPTATGSQNGNIVIEKFNEQCYILQDNCAIFTASLHE